MICEKCKTEVLENDVFCRKCGTPIKKEKSQKIKKPNAITAKHVLIGIFFPPLGFALWGLYVQENPIQAKNYLLFSGIGVLFYIIGFIAANI
ncbi:MAG: hypothetical protein PHT83_01415 [Bacilli bacterium]|nr:hypothetical protein [Bacilli bacterium]